MPELWGFGPLNWAAWVEAVAVATIGGTILWKGGHWTAKIAAEIQSISKIMAEGFKRNDDAHTEIREVQKDHADTLQDHGEEIAKLRERTGTE